jgi:hypothetical protein
MSLDWLLIGTDLRKLLRLRSSHSCVESTLSSNLRGRFFPRRLAISERPVTTNIWPHNQS